MNSNSLEETLDDRVSDSSADEEVSTDGSVRLKPRLPKRTPKNQISSNSYRYKRLTKAYQQVVDSWYRADRLDVKSLQLRIVKGDLPARWCDYCSFGQPIDESSVQRNDCCRRCEQEMRGGYWNPKHRIPKNQRGLKMNTSDGARVIQCYRCYNLYHEGSFEKDKLSCLGCGPVLLGAVQMPLFARQPCDLNLKSMLAHELQACMAKCRIPYSEKKGTKAKLLQYAQGDEDRLAAAEDLERKLGFTGYSIEVP